MATQFPPLTDPTLAKMRQNIESKLPAKMKEGYLRIVVAGMKLLFSDQTHTQVREIIQRVTAGGNKPETIAVGMVNLIGLLYKASNGKMAFESAFPAMVTLLAYVLEYMEHTSDFKATPEFIKALGPILFRQFTKTFRIQRGAQQGAPGTTAPPPGMPSPAGATQAPPGGPPGLVGAAAAPPPPAMQGGL